MVYSPGRGRVGYGRGEYTLEAESEALDGVALRRVIVEVLGDERFKMPVLPAAAKEVLEVSKRPDVAFEDIQRIVEKDVSLAGKVLQVAQSPNYTTRVQARTLRDAVQRLGVKNIRDIVWQVAVDLRVFRAPGYEPVMDALQRHSVATAHAAKRVCDYTSVSADYAFLCGLLHDIGLAATLVALTAAKSGQALPALDVLWPALDEVHAAAAAYVLRSWKLDPDLRLVVEHHHESGGQTAQHPLIAVLCVAEVLVGELGYDVLPEPPFETLFGRRGLQEYESAMENLGLSTATLKSIREQVQAQLEHLGI